MAQGTTPNSREPICAQDMLTHESFYVEGTSSTGAINVNANISISDTITVDGVVTANAGTNLNTSALALESGGNLATIAGAISATHMQTDVLTLPANASVNNAQINGVAPLMGAGNTGTGSQRVTIATDQVAIASKAAINTYVDGSIVTIGAKADAKSTATDTTAVTMMSVLKQISASTQAPPSQAITNADLTTIAGAVSGTHMQVDILTAPTTAVTGTFWQATQPVSGTVTANTGLTQPLTDTQLRATAVPVSLASVPSHAVTNAGTFAVQSTNQANSGVDIGDVTVNNAAGASAVNIQDGGNVITVDGAITATLSAETTKVIGTVNQGTSPWVTSGAVTNTVLSVVGGGTEATAQRVTIASDSTGTLTVDGAVTANAGTNLNTSALALDTTVQKLNGFSMPVFDSIYPTYNSTTDVYVYKLSASTVATITISYVDSTKAVMTSIVRS